jgi:hypothetical protein
MAKIRNTGPTVPAANDTAGPNSNGTRSGNSVTT